MAVIHCRQHSCPNLLPHRRGAGTKKNVKKSAALTGSIPLTAGAESWEFYYCNGAARTVGKALVTYRGDKYMYTCIHLHAYIHEGSELPPQVINTCPKTL